MTHYFVEKDKTSKTFNICHFSGRKGYIETIIFESNFKTAKDARNRIKQLLGL